MANELVRRVIPEQPVRGKRLGRHINHDPRSRAFAIAAVPTTWLRTVRNRRLVGVYNQGQVGSCTGNACAGVLSTRPFRHYYRAQSTALKIYQDATRIDPYEGTYLPSDTGSDGLSVAKVAKNRGLISEYRHAFGLVEMLTALQTGAVMIGVNWYDSFDRPGSDGLVTLSPGAQVRGGHEMEVSQLLLASEGNYQGSDRIRLPQSWGTGFGNRGWIEMTIDTLDRLLHEDGDCTVMVP